MKFIAEKGYDPNYGARPLKRVIQDKILNPVAEFIIGRKVEEGGIIVVDADPKKEGLVVSVKETGKRRARKRLSEEMFSQGTSHAK